MRRRPYSGPPMVSREGTAGLRARLARAAAAPRPGGVFPIASSVTNDTARAARARVLARVNERKEIMHPDETPRCTYEFHSIEPRDYRDFGEGCRKATATVAAPADADARQLALTAAKQADLLPGEYLAVQRPNAYADEYIDGWSFPVKVTAPVESTVTQNR